MDGQYILRCRFDKGKDQIGGKIFDKTPQIFVLPLFTVPEVVGQLIGKAQPILLNGADQLLFSAIPIFSFLRRTILAEGFADLMGGQPVFEDFRLGSPVIGLTDPVIGPCRPEIDICKLDIFQTAEKVGQGIADGVGIIPRIAGQD